MSHEKVSTIETVEIKQGAKRPIKFAIVATDECKFLASSIKSNLEVTKRFVESKNKASFIITIKKDSFGKIKVQLSDVQTKKNLLDEIVSNSNDELKVADKIYEALTKEPGILQTELILCIYSGKNTCCLYSIGANKSEFRRISDKIYNISDLFLCDGKIFFNVYSKKIKGFILKEFDQFSKISRTIFTIRHASITAPVIYEGELYFAVTYDVTTGIYKMPYLESKKVKSYSSFQAFKSDPMVNTIVEIKNLIATSVTISEGGKVAFCREETINKPTIYIYPNTKVSSNNDSYFDPSIRNNYLIANKTGYGKFHLVLINLKNGIEKTLLTKYYISKPVWSPCGNWIAVSCRNRYETDKIILVHKSGKYMQTISSDQKIKNIIWKNKKEQS